MAWNDVKKSTNKAVHLLVTIDNRQFNFRQAADIKVERKIGDTMSKFSLGIIDDSGSNPRSDYVEFERYLLNRFVNIEIMYGNAYNDLSKFTGFVVDYQPVFFGSTTKLTVTGYLTKSTVSNKGKLTSPYNYWYDWTPYLGVRKDKTKVWDELYIDGNLKLNSEMYKAALNLGAKQEINENVDLTQDATVMSKINSVLGSELNAYKQQRAAFESDMRSLLIKNPGIISGDWGGLTNITSITVDWEKEMVTIKGTGQRWAGYGDEVYTFNDYEESYPISTIQNILNEVNHGYGSDSYNWSSSVSENRNNFQQAHLAYERQREKLLRLAVLDALDVQNAQGAFKGAIPFHPDIMEHYEGNTQFSDLVHPSTNRKLKRVCPDLFIKWDNVVPLTNFTEKQIEEMDLDKLTKVSNEFSNHVICDIKVFGLRYTIDNSKLASNNVKDAFTLLAQDRWGTHRVYGTKQGYYIWVGDIPDLWKSFKESKDFEYQATKTSFKFNKNEQTTEGIVFKEKTSYKKGEIVICSDGHGDYKTKRAEVINSFKTDSNPNKGFLNFADNHKGINKLWDEAIRNDNIREIEDWSDEQYKQYKIKNHVRDYYIWDLREQDERYGWINDMKKEERGNVVQGRDLNGRSIKLNRENRIKMYLQSAFRSAMPLAYGQVRISDIVKQLAYLEGWDNAEITGTTLSPYTSSWLCMNGQSALEYISETLGPNAVEAGGGRTGFTTYFDKNKLIFRPINMQYTNNIVFETGYNRKDSDVLSFTVRSRGMVLMTGVNSEVSALNAYTNQAITATTQTKNGTSMSDVEAKLRKQAINTYSSDSSELANLDESFFNLPLYYYYGKNVNSEADFVNFVKNVSESSIAYIPHGDQNIIKSRNSSTSGSTETVIKALASLDTIRNTCIQAEMTIMGHNTLAPGQWIEINNYTRRGPHYTSGKYFIQSITDQVSAGSGFTQNLTLWRYSKDVAAMSSGTSRLDAAILMIRENNMEKFNQWFQNTYPEDANSIATSDFGYDNRYGDNKSYTDNSSY